MLILGISGGADLVYEFRDYLFPHGNAHDSAAVLVDNGRVVAAIEEERLNRIKHTNKGPVSAIKFCLDSNRAQLSDVDRLVIAADEQLLAKVVRYKDLQRMDAEPLMEPRGFVHELLVQGLGQDIDDEKISFVRHHLSHAMSVYALSGFDRSLVVTMDGSGDEIAGSVFNGENNSMELLRSTPIPKSLGLLYLKVIEVLGYELFDEYKVMGLAPYGDPSKYRDLFKSFYELLPDGEYSYKIDLPDDLHSVTRPRKKSEPFTQVHTDIAAAIQESLEDITFHVLRHFKQQTNQSHLCLSGGVAHNCTLNGKILYSGMFDRVFVQPAAHDAGLGLGAALYTFFKENPGASIRPRMEHVFLGTDTGSSESILKTLSDWEDFLDFEYVDDITGTTARLLADGQVIGWVQGRSEFGPRALGNRSIVADPRPPENKDIINSMVKKREAYRPFAPSVLEEYVEEFFDLPDQKVGYEFMTFVVNVQKEKQDLLAATTHVDGTARIQTVSKKTNRMYWELIEAFRQITGIPVLLNTSFNNNVEPIVDSVTDAIVSFLTTRLHCLVVGNYLARRKPIEGSQHSVMIVSLPLYARLNLNKRYISPAQTTTIAEIQNTFHPKYNIRISPEAFQVLSEADGTRTLQQLFDCLQIEDDKKRASLIEEIVVLWTSRAVTLVPLKQPIAKI